MSAFTGVDHVDLAAAKAAGAVVSNASGYSNQAVAELAIEMMLSLLRNVPQVEARCRAGSDKTGLVGRELKGKTVGIVGLGKIGRTTARLLPSLQSQLIRYQPVASERGAGRNRVHARFPAAGRCGYRSASLPA